MRLVQNAVIGPSTRPSPYSFGSISSISNTGGVIQPAQGLSRGKIFRSRISTLKPAWQSAQAQEEPAGPPPTINTSHLVISLSFGELLFYANLLKLSGFRRLGLRIK